MMKYKKEKEKIEAEYRQKLQDLKDSYVKYAKFAPGDIVFYKTPIPNLAYKYDERYYVSIGVIGDILLEHDDIRYFVKLLDILEEELVPGSNSVTVCEYNILNKICSTPIYLKEFNKLIN